MSSSGSDARDLSQSSISERDPSSGGGPSAGSHDSARDLNLQKGSRPRSRSPSRDLAGESIASPGSPSGDRDLGDQRPTEARSQSRDGEESSEYDPLAKTPEGTPNLNTQHATDPPSPAYSPTSETYGDVARVSLSLDTEEVDEEEGDKEEETKEELASVVAEESDVPDPDGEVLAKEPPTYIASVWDTLSPSVREKILSSLAGDEEKKQTVESLIGSRARRLQRQQRSLIIDAEPTLSGPPVSTNRREPARLLVSAPQLQEAAPVAQTEVDSGSATEDSPPEGSEEEQEILEPEEEKKDILGSVGVFPSLYKKKNDKGLVVFKSVESVLREDQGEPLFVSFCRRQQSVFKNDDSEKLIEMALLELTTCVNNLATGDLAKPFLLYNDSGAARPKTFSNSSLQVHSPLCLARWLKEAPPMVKVLSDVREFNLRPGAAFNLSSFECCNELWAPRLTGNAIKLTMAHFACSRLLEHRILKEGDVEAVERRKTRSDVVKRVDETGIERVDIFQGLDLQGKTVPEYMSAFLRNVFRYYGRLNRDTGCPYFMPITNKIVIREGEVLEQGECPLTRSPRVQLYLSKKFINEALPGFYDHLVRFFGCRELVFSLLYTEGINALRFDSDFLNACREKQLQIPESEFLDEEWLRKNFLDARRWVERLSQTAHKDVVKGYFTERAPEYLPYQLIMALDGDNVKFHAWLKRDEEGKGIGLLQHQSSYRDWKQNELAQGYRRETFHLKKYESVVFHALQTHAGDGSSSNFRLFVGTVNTPETFSIDSMNQTYLQLEKRLRFSYKPVPSHIIRGEEKHQDDSPYVQKRTKRRMNTGLPRAKLYEWVRSFSLAQ